MDDNRGTLATLRRGISGQPYYDLNLRRFIASHIPDEDRDQQYGGKRERTYYLIAALYANHPYDTHEGNLGSHLRTASGLRNDRDAAERRFTALLNARLEDLHKPLLQAINMLDCPQQKINVNWLALFKDLLNWDDPQKITQRNWANGFWTYEKPDNGSSENQPTQDQ